MFALLYVGTPFRIGNSVVDRYNRSVVHIPFTAPPSSNSFQLPAGTPWKADDCIYEEESTLAVAKGKLYVVCEVNHFFRFLLFIPFFVVL